MADANSTRPPMHSRSSNGTPLYERVCPSCGAIAIVDFRKLGKLCNPCANRARSTHGHAARGKLTPIYKIYSGMKSRCEQPSYQHYKYYGGRGIKVCKEWRDNPQVFIDWAMNNGWRSGLEIDRKNSDGDYCPDNCKFATHRENSQHTRRIKTTPDQARRAREMLNNGCGIKETASAVGVTYMVAWHIKHNPDVWRNA